MTTRDKILLGTLAGAGAAWALSAVSALLPGPGGDERATQAQDLSGRLPDLMNRLIPRGTRPA